MTNEEFEKRMAFIIEQQAQFAADIQLLRETQGQTERVVAQLAHVTHAGFGDVNAKINALVDSHIRLTEGHSRLAEAQSRTEENLRNMSGKVDALVDSQIRLTESQSRTDESLRNMSAKVDALVTLVDRYFRERRNGDSGR